MASADPAAPAAPTALGIDRTPGTPPAGSRRRQRLGELLVSQGLISEPALAAALDEQKRSGVPLGQVVVELGYVTEANLVAALARQLGMRVVDLIDYPIDPEAVALLSDALARRYLALPIGFEGSKVLVAMADPSNVFAMDDLQRVIGREVVAVAATRPSIQSAINRHYRLDGEVESITAAAAGALDAADELAGIREVVEDTPIVKLVNLVISQAIADRASDIHIEPTEHDVRIRYRIDGVLHEVMRSPKTLQAGIASRLKIMSDIDIGERRLPQDGRMSADVGGHSVDLRVATLPTVHGEKIVLRVLDRSHALMQLSDLGFLPANWERYQQAFRKPYGTILVTGPTGSGKSTTLYATLNQLTDVSKNVITVEDPVEYRMPSVNQIQVNVKAGLTFATALRSILRADPDVLLVGEIRDRETATIAIEAALTGHLVLSTLHTNDAASTPSRLIEMGVEPFLVGSSIDCIVAQRLARRLCDNCKTAHELTDTQRLRLAADAVDVDVAVSYRPNGCSLCGRTGYLGRFAIHEILNVNEAISQMIGRNGHSVEIRQAAIEDGMLTLRQAGMLQVAAGLTSFEEILRVVA